MILRAPTVQCEAELQLECQNGVCTLEGAAGWTLESDRRGLGWLWERGLETVSKSPRQQEEVTDLSNKDVLGECCT